MKKGSLDWLTQSSGPELDPLADVTHDPAVAEIDTFAVTALDFGVAETDEDRTGDQALPAEVTEGGEADGVAAAHTMVVVEVLASAKAPAAADATTAHGIVVADVPAAADATGAYAAVVADPMTSGAAAAASTASAEGGNETLARNGAMDAPVAFVAGQPVTLDEGDGVQGDWSGEVIIDLPIIIGGDAGAYDYSWSSTFSTSVGDINGDGFDDALVATYSSDAQGNYSFGSHVVFGSAEGADAGVDPASLDGTNGFRLLAGGGDVYGWSVSGAGDVNGDGFDDLLVGTYSYDPDGNYTQTKYLVYGAADGFAAGVEVERGTVVESDDGYTDGGSYDYSWSWSSLSSVGDVNGDGFDDTLVATYDADAQGNYSFGSYVVFGGGSSDAEIDPGSLDGTNGFRLLAGGGDVYGWAVSGAGDVNGDGFDDLLVGTYGYDPDGDYAATTYLIYGAADGFASGVDVASLGTVVEGDDAYAGGGYYDGSYDYSSGSYLVFGLDTLAPTSWL